MKGIRAQTANEVVNVILDWKLNNKSAEDSMAKLYQLLLSRCIIQRDSVEFQNKHMPFTVSSVKYAVDSLDKSYVGSAWVVANIYNTLEEAEAHMEEIEYDRRYDWRIREVLQ